MRLIVFEGLTGKPLYVNPDAVCFVSDAGMNDGAPISRVLFSGQELVVKGHVAETANLLAG